MNYALFKPPSNSPDCNICFDSWKFHPINGCPAKPPPQVQHEEQPEQQPPQYVKPSLFKRIQLFFRKSFHFTRRRKNKN